MGLDQLDKDEEAVTPRDSRSSLKDYDTPVFTRKEEVEKFAPARVVKPTILGLDDNGEMEHNFPCPVCTKKPAKYTELKGKHVFAPCDDCATDGYSLIKKKSFWSWQ